METFEVPLLWWAFPMAAEETSVPIATPFK